jgi:GNAT superfamily N-acetyltransferase
MRIEAVGGRCGLRRFLAVPKALYPRTSPWVAPLDFERRAFFDPRKNAFFDHATVDLLVAVDSRGRDVGRIAAIDNPRYNEFQETALGFFGFFEAPDDAEIANVLLAEARYRSAEQGYARIHGPVHPSTNHECGLLVDGFDDPPVLQMPYNHGYYEKLLLGEGFEAVQDLLSFIYHLPESLPPQLERARKLLARRNKVEVRPLRWKEFDAELARVKDIYNEAWSSNFGFVPLTEREIDCLARDLKPILDPELCWFAEVGGEVAGVCLLLLDYNQLLGPLRGSLLPFGWWKLLTGKRTIDRARGMVMGVRPRFRKMGIDYAFYDEVFRTLQRRGIGELDISWVLEQNRAMREGIERIGAHAYKTHRLYERDVT